MIDTRLLIYFLAVAREQNFTRAAEALNVTQPTLSKQMMQLEEQLGKQLFVRGKKVTLTEEGEYLRARAQEIVDLVSVTEDTIRMENVTISGDITIGCGETATMGFLTEIFAGLHEEYPDIRLHTFSGDAAAMMERLDKGLIDIALLLGPQKKEKYDYFDLKRKDHFGLLLRRDHPLAEKKAITVKDLVGLPMAFPQQQDALNSQKEWFGKAAEKFNIIATYNLIYNATFLVEQGVCAAFCLDKLIPTDGARDLTFRPMKPEITVDSFLVTKKYDTFSPAVKLFLERVKSSITESS